jgi:nucleotide-binding universal stress UspA family protein
MAETAVFLVAYDGSQSACRAADYAVRMASARAAHLVFVYVHNTTLTAVVPSMVPEVGTAAEDSNAEVAAEIEALMKPSAVSWELRCERGNPFQLLVRAASEHGAEAIVLGTTRRTGLHLSGSLAVNLVKHADWPVVVVP